MLAILVKKTYIHRRISIAHSMLIWQPIFMKLLEVRELLVMVAVVGPKTM